MAANKLGFGRINAIVTIPSFELANLLANLPAGLGVRAVTIESEEGVERISLPLPPDFRLKEPAGPFRLRLEIVPE